MSFPDIGKGKAINIKRSYYMVTDARTRDS
jgi:hypothetical protein